MTASPMAVLMKHFLLQRDRSTAPLFYHLTIERAPAANACGMKRDSPKAK
jgi:hypothetical protein